MELIESKEDWQWYCDRLDVESKYKHLHKGFPVKYPCKVESEWGDDPIGPYYYNHRFFYQEVKCCEKCNHKTYDWQVK